MAADATNSRPSRFIEGTEHTQIDMITRAPTNPELFNSILSEMDAHPSTTSGNTVLTTSTSPTTTASNSTSTSPITATTSPFHIPQRRARNASNSSSTSSGSFEVVAGRRGTLSGDESQDDVDNVHQSGAFRHSLDAIKRVIETNDGGDKKGLKSKTGTIKGRLRALTGGER